MAQLSREWGVTILRRSITWDVALGDVVGGHGEVGWAGGLRGLFQPEWYWFYSNGNGGPMTTMGALINGSMLGG